MWEAVMRDKYGCIHVSHDEANVKAHLEVKAVYQDLSQILKLYDKS
jgi:hypothetical protein